MYLMNSLHCNEHLSKFTLFLNEIFSRLVKPLTELKSSLFFSMIHTETFLDFGEGFQRPSDKSLFCPVFLVGQSHSPH